MIWYSKTLYAYADFLGLKVQFTVRQQLAGPWGVGQEVAIVGGCWKCLTPYCYWDAVGGCCLCSFLLDTDWRLVSRQGSPSIRQALLVWVFCFGPGKPTLLKDRNASGPVVPLARTTGISRLSFSFSCGV
jgi:hypothetical protein